MDIQKYTCNLCNKIYKSYKSLWFHKYKYHNNDSISPQKTSCITQNNSNNTHLSSNSIQENNIIENDQLTCEYCKNKYSRLDNLNRHIKTCKVKDNIIKENKELIKQNEEKDKQIEEIKQSFEKFKKQMIDMINKQCKMHPKKLNKLINNSHNTTTNSHNNLTINNNQINIIELGDEKLNDIFTKEEKLKILNRGYSSLEEIIKHAHLNEKYLQFQNIIITNKRNNEAYMYNGMLKKFILVDKTELLDNLIEYRFDDLSSFYDEYKNKLEPKLRINLEKMFKLKDDDEYSKRKRDEFNILFYNESNKDLIKYKKLEDNESILN